MLCLDLSGILIHHLAEDIEIHLSQGKYWMQSSQFHLYYLQQVCLYQNMPANMPCEVKIFRQGHFVVVGAVVAVCRAVEVRTLCRRNRGKEFFVCAPPVLWGIMLKISSSHSNTMGAHSTRRSFFLMDGVQRQTSLRSASQTSPTMWMVGDADRREVCLYQKKSLYLAAQSRLVKPSALFLRLSTHKNLSA